ncbi:MAG: hypothetical protein LBR43_01225 [Spiroplasmataceae bacterium]|nr:hypothetical protein [Spiroplasmataceae bacterium]
MNKPLILKEWEERYQQYLQGKISEQCVVCGEWIKSNSAQCNYCFIRFY